MPTTGTDRKALLFVGVVVLVATMVPARWRLGAQRAWLFLVYCVGYRLLSVHLSCHSLAVSGVPFVVKCAI